MCQPCYKAHLAKQQQAQGLRCSGCGAEGAEVQWLCVEVVNHNDLCFEAEERGKTGLQRTTST